MKTRLLFLIAMLVATPLHAQTQATTQRPPSPSVEQSVGPANIKLTFYLIQADGFPNDDADIRAITTELRKIFKFTGYRLASKSVLQSAMDSKGWSSARQMVSDPEGVNYMIYAETSASAEGSLRLSVSLRAGTSVDSTLIDASINLKDNKTVVLGSAMGGKDKAIILAVTPTIER